MLRHRLIFGALFIATLALLGWADVWLDAQSTPRALAPLFPRSTFPPGMVVFLVCLVLAVMGGRELARILTENGVTASRRITIFAAVLGLVVSVAVPEETSALTAVAIVSSSAIIAMLAAIAYYSRNRTVEGTVAAASGTLLAFVYLGLCLGFILALRRDYSVWVLLWVLAVVKSSDIGAYFTGRTIGRHKMIPWLSPGKTWEGMFGGATLAAAVGAVGIILLERAGEPRVPGPLNGAVAGAAFAFVGQLGDLVESLFKRDAGRKDSGSSLPGFGGVLDLIDSPLLVAPAAFWWLAVFAR